MAACLLIFGVSLGNLQAQLAEKIYDLDPYGDIAFTTVENIPASMGSGQILVSGITDGGTERTVIMRVGVDGTTVWERLFTPTGGISFDQDVMVKSHRIGFHPDNGTVLVTGESGIQPSGAIYHAPAFIELNLSTGQVINEHYYENAMFPYTRGGIINAIHTVVGGANEGAYMVGMVLTPTAGRVPFIAKVGVTTEFQKMSHQAQSSSDPYLSYFDVDVDNANGYVIAAGVKQTSSKTLIPDVGDYGIVDVYNTSGTLLYTHQYSLSGGEKGRFSSVKCVGPGRVVLGGIRNGRAFVMQIHAETGDIHWSRYVTGIDEDEFGDVIEVEQDAEGNVVIMAVTTPGLYEMAAAGPGIVARLLPNGLADWAIAEAMEGGVGDLEPQYTSDDHLAMLTSVLEEEALVSRLTFLDHTNGFYGCQTEKELDTPTEHELSRESGDERAYVVMDEYGVLSPDEEEIEVNYEDGCCWLPAFNPMPWNHPWESMYYENQAVIDLPTTYYYDWNLIHNKELESGFITTTSSHLSVGGTNNSQLTVDFENPFSYSVGSRYAERNRIYVLAYEGPGATGCVGRDDINVTLVEDGGIVVRPDYTNSSYGNEHEHPSYTYCQGSANDDTYLYQHKGWILDSDGFITTGVPLLLPYPNAVNSSSGTNYLASTTTTPHYFEEKVEDYFQSSPTPRTIKVVTDLEVIGCPLNCAPTMTIEKWTAENGRRFYSLTSTNLTPRPKIVNYAFSLHLNDASMEEHERVKRLEIIRGPALSAIDGYDYLIPLIDERYMDSYPAYQSSVLNKLYLDVWLSTDALYPYDITCHKRYVYDFDPNEVYRLSGSWQEVPVENEAAMLQVFPNPGRGLFSLQGIEGKAELEVLNAAGKLVWSATIHATAGGSELLDLQTFPAGFYLLKVQTQKGSSLHKLMKE